MNVDSYLRRLVEANAPYWGGEAEVARHYFTSNRRTQENDRIWLERQMYKELWDGFVPPLENKVVNFHLLEDSVTRSDLLAAAEMLYEELAHYCAFADVYEQLIDGDGSMPNPATLKTRGQWAENLQLMELRAAHKATYGDLGTRAHAFTEGGYCTLYSEGMKLQGRGGIDDMIAEACASVYDDEFDHMLLGIKEVGSGLAPEDWAILTDLTVEQMRYRIRMRNAQFGFPVDPRREGELCAGKADPMAFDYARAGLAPG